MSVFTAPAGPTVEAIARALAMPPKGVRSAGDLGRSLYSAGLQTTGGRLTQAVWQGVLPG